MQLLLAIEVPENVKSAVADQIQDFKKLYPQFKWIQPERFVINIQSFGNSFEVKNVIARLQKILFENKSFFLYSNSIQLTIQKNITLYLDFQREKEVEKINTEIRQEFPVFDNGLKFLPILILANYKIPSKQQYFVIKKRISKLTVDVSFRINKLALFADGKKIQSFKLL